MHRLLVVAALVVVPLVAQAADLVVGRDARTQTALTVYSAGLDLAVVRDTRQLTLDGGEGVLRFDDVAARIDPRTVSLRSTTSPEQLTVLEQSYLFDLASPQQLLQRWIGHGVELVERDTRLRSKTTPATLLSVDGGNVYRVEDRIVVGNTSEVRLPPLGTDVYVRPTLRWRLANAGPPAQTLEVSYATGGLSWTADYVATLNAAQTAADVTAWVTLENQSGARYDDATLTLIAGDVHRATAPEQAMFRGHAMAAAPKMADAAVSEAPLAQYHRYALERRTTIVENETKQVPLFVARAVGVKRRYVVDGQAHWFRSEARDVGRDLPVRVIVDVANTDANHLGRPLPAGVVRLYAPDPSGAPQLVGEDRIPHTPAGETAKLEAGAAFDLRATRKQTDFKQLDIEPYQFESAFEIALRNRSHENVTITVREPVNGEWTVVESSVPPEKLDARTLAFQVPVPANGETVLRYRVKVGDPGVLIQRGIGRQAP
jgi:hypothetical protein